MPGRVATLRQSDLTRYAKAMRAGIAEFRVEVEPGGKVVIVAGRAGSADTPNPCDRLLE